MATQKVIGTGPVKYDALLDSEREADGPNPLNPANLILGGHSYMDPSGVGIAYQPQTKYATGARISSLLGVDPGRVNNLAVSGAVLRSHTGNGAPRYVQNINPGSTLYLPQISRNGCSFFWFGINDLILGAGSAQQAGIQNGYRSIIARMRATAVWDYNDPTVVTTGTWTATLYSSLDVPWGSGAGCWGSSTVGDYVTITLPTDLSRDLPGVWVDVGAVTTQASTSGAFTVSKNGVSQGTLSTNGGCFGSSERGSNVFRVYVTASEIEAGATIRVTIAAVTGSNPIYFDYWQVEADPAPLVLIGEITVPPNPSAQWAGITIAYIDSANGWIRDVIAEFNDPAVQMVYLDKALGGANNRLYYKTSSADFTYYNHDGLHPNDRGAQRVAQEVSKAIRKALNAGVTRDQITGYYEEELDPITATQATIYHGTGTGAPLQLINDFDGPDSTTTPSGWTALMGGWGTFQNELAVVNDKWQYPDAWDTFNRQDGSVGNSWSALSGTWAIVSNELACTASTASVPLLSWGNRLDTSGNGYIEFTVGTVRRNFSGVFFRYQDSSNYWRLYMSVSFGGWVLVKVVGGSTTIVQNAGMGVSTSGTTMHIELNGSSISVYNNNTLQVTKTDSDLQTSRVVGVCAEASISSGNQPTIDDFKVKAGATDLTNDVGFNAVVREFGVSDNIFQFTVGQERNDFNGAIFRYVDPTHYLTLYMSATFGGWVFGRNIGGQTATHNVSMSNAVGKKIAIAMSGSDFNFYVDGTAANAGDSVDMNIDATGGTFDLTIQTTLGTSTLTNVAYNISATSLQTSLRSSGGFTSTTVTVIGGPGASGGLATYAITCAGSLGTTVGAIISYSVNGTNLTGGGATASIFKSVTRGSSAGTWSIPTAVSGTKHGLRTSYNHTIPYSLADDVLQGYTLINVPDNAYYRSDTTGTLYGPFESGAYTDQIPWLPYQYIDAKGDLIIGTADNAAQRLAVGTNDYVLTADSAQTTGAKWAAVPTPVSYNNQLLPTGAKYQSLDRMDMAAANMTLLTSGTLYLTAINLPSGTVCNSITFVVGTAAVTPTNQWFGIFDSSRVALRVTSDNTNTAQTNNTALTLNLSSAFTTTYSGLHYVGIMIAAGTTNTLWGSVDAAFSPIGGVAPIISGDSTTGLTTPVSVPSTATAITAARFKPYFYIS